MSLDLYTIMNYQFNDKFFLKLKEEYAWSDDFAKRAVFEYKRFTYLAYLENNSKRPKKVVPSLLVELVWRTNLLYTKEYWLNFCQNTLQFWLHYAPSDSISYSHYNYTLERYKEVFGDSPPSDIWQGIPKREEKYIYINSSKYHIIDKDQLLTYKNLTALFAGILTYLGVFELFGLLGIIIFIIFFPMDSIKNKFSDKGTTYFGKLINNVIS